MSAPSSVKKTEIDSSTNMSKARELFKALKTCPPVRPFTTIGALTLLALLIYGTLWGARGEKALPGSPLFGLFALVLISYLGGQFMRIFKLPTLVGMMIVGFLLRNVPIINVAKDILAEWSEIFRHVALVFILLRAGLELDANRLKNNKRTVAMLIFIPFVAELVAAGLAARLLFPMPWNWSFLLGSILSAVSPAVVLPVMLKLKKRGIGVATGIPTMVIAVAGIDDVLALSAFGVMLGIIFSTASLAWTIAKGPLDMLLGIVYGTLLGVISWYIPNPNEDGTSVFRFLILCLGGLCILFDSYALKWGPAGALGCICLAFVASLGWKKEKTGIRPVENALAFVWMIVEPFLFGLVGAEIRIDYLKPNEVGLGLATMFIGIAARMLAAFASAFFAGLTLKEQIFVTFAGLPKATVQAAIGPVALTLARKQALGAEAENFGIMILTTAVLCIIITAPLGAISILLLAPRLLDKKRNSNDEEKQKPDTTDDDNEKQNPNTTDDDIEKQKPDTTDDDNEKQKPDTKDESKLYKTKVH